MSVLISGSIAYDNILSYEGRFGDHLVAGSLDHINLSFVTSGMSRNYGGCAANIAYALMQLGGAPLLIGAVGTDGTDYLTRLDMLGIENQVAKFNDTYTAQCFVTTDMTGAQIAAFNPGAMMRSGEVRVPEGAPIEIAIIAPDSKQAMIARAEELHDLKVPFIFDVGQAVSLFDGNELKSMIARADFIIASEYELDLISRSTGFDAASIATQVKALIVTHGEKGSSAYISGSTITVPACPAPKAIDPVGAGDAFRGGLLFGLTHGFDWKNSLRLGSVMGAFNVETVGGQNYSLTKAQIAERYEATYGEALNF